MKKTTVCGGNMKTGVIGIGAIAGVHLAVLEKMGADVVALCDIDTEKCHAANEKFGFSARVYSSYIEMLDKEELDIVHICTPHYLHAEMICHALKKNINVLCEKPVAISYEQLDMIEAAVNSSRAQLGVCFQTRYGAPASFAREFFDGKKITSAVANLTWQRDAAYYASGAWRGKYSTEGGGVMINQAIHSLDMLVWMCGMPTSVIAHVSNNSLRGVVEVEDTAYGLFEFDGGNFIINATNAAKYSYPVSLSFHSDGDTLEICSDNIIVNGKLLVGRDGTPVIGKEVWGTGHTKLIADFYSKVARGEKFPIDFAEASKSLRLILAMYRSNGEKVNI